MKKIYILADSLESFQDKVNEYETDPNMDLTGLEFVYLTGIGQIDTSRAEIWDCSELRQSLHKLNYTLIGGM